MLPTQRAWKGHIFIAASVDGYIARENGDLTWLTTMQPDTRHAPGHSGMDAPPTYEGFTAHISHLVMGRGTYEKVLSFDVWPYEKFTVLVLSTTLAHGADPRITVVRSITEATTFLDDAEASHVYVDGGQILTEFLRNDLIDDLTITRAPILLGQGLRLFHALPHDIHLTHLGTATFDTGMVSTRYAIPRKQGEGS